jgi:hypothetical protein
MSMAMINSVMRRTVLVLLVCGALAPQAYAQDRPRFEIAAGAVAQPATTSFLSVSEFPYFAETARLEADHQAGEGIAFDVGVNVAVWRALAARVAVTRTTHDTASETRGSFPHPFFFNTNRTGTWTSDALDRSELGVHLSADWMILRGGRFGLSVFGGPTWFQFTQGVVENVDVIQSYPYDTIDATLATGEIDGSVFGFHAGVDASWFFSRYVGVGGVIRYAAGEKKGLRIGEGQPFDLDLGGAQGGGGIRIRF